LAEKVLVAPTRGSLASGGHVRQGAAPSKHARIYSIGLVQ